MQENIDLNRIDSNNPFEKVGSNLSENVTHNDSTTIVTHRTRQDQYDRLLEYRSHLEESQLYSLTISSNGIECYESDCQPSVFTESYQCRMISHDQNMDSFNELPLMNDQDIKQNISYISLTSLSQIIDHEPNVSRKDSISRPKSNILLHKPSLFLTDILNKMTNEQLAKSIAQLTKLHESRTKLISLEKLPRTNSLPNLNKKPKKLYSVNSLLSERRIPPNKNHGENEISSMTRNEQKHTDDDTSLLHIDIEIPNDKYRTDTNGKTRSSVIKERSQTPVHISEPLDRHIIASKLKSLPKRKLSQENHQAISINDSLVTTSAISSPIVHLPIVKSSSKCDEQVSNWDPSSTSKINPIDTNNTLLSSKPMINLTSINDEQVELAKISKETNNQLRQTTNFEKSKQSLSKCEIKQSRNDVSEKNNINQSLKDFSLCNKITDHPSQTNVLL
ncbi:unnamed protein product [Rotaria socialis]|uniref:Uncharacterized protein n=1 Tax=Rotaria socialis TaxID=392032 RepID=A0A820J178_9BILA|nr:unnamed protein product [Rotaria socialis]CAF4318093.1 unnamed protein product [Rotaria socialis]